MNAMPLKLDTVCVHSGNACCDLATSLLKADNVGLLSIENSPFFLDVPNFTAQGYIKLVLISTEILTSS